VTVTTRRFTRTDPRLGRHVRHDTRSHRYAVGVLPKSAIKKVQWTRRIPILDQLQLGKCTAESFTGVTGTDNAAGQGQTSVTLPTTAKTLGFLPVGQSLALDDTFSTAFYSIETRDDAYDGQYPPDDTGSDALGAMAGAKALGLVTQYQHAMSYAAAVSAIQSGALMWGTTFYNSMEDLDKKGYFVVNPKSGVAGGHEMVLTGYDPETDEWTGDNSWNESWGPLDGSFKITGKNLTLLLKDDGDVTLPVFSFAPIVPVPPTPPTPTPPAPATVDDAALWSAAQSWAAGKGFAV
jgi:hypothetical protein